jgi:CheY-like chemotaxis protein
MAKILVVEDNEVNRDLIVRRLGRQGYQVLTAVDGQQGIDMAMAESPDLILMDMSLPVIDGWEATRTLRRIPALRNVPIIAVTAHAMSEDRAKALEAGCDDYAAKPIDMPKLNAMIDSLLKRVKPA